MKYLFLILLLATISFQCKEESELVPMAYYSTQCAYPWHQEVGGIADLQLEQKIEQYFTATINDDFQDLHIIADEDYLISCRACNCPASKFIHVDVPEADISHYEAVGFERH